MHRNLLQSYNSDFIMFLCFSQYARFFMNMYAVLFVSENCSNAWFLVAFIFHVIFRTTFTIAFLTVNTVAISINVGSA